MMNLIAYADGARDLAEIAEIIGAPMWELMSLVEKLQDHGLMKIVDGARATVAAT